MNTAVIGDDIPRRGTALSRFLCIALMWLCGWRVEAIIPNLPKFVLIGAPHTSNWDFLLAMGVIFGLGINVSWMGKHTMFRWPFKGLLTWLGGIPVNRNLANRGLVAQTISAFDGRDKLIVAMMPEGTRTKVKTWKTGFYHIAVGAQVPLVLVAFDYGRRVMNITHTIFPTGDLEADLARIQTIFSSVRGKHPHQY